MRKPSNAQEAKARDSRLIGVAQMNDHEASETLTILFPFQLLKSYLAHPHRDSLAAVGLLRRVEA